MEKMQKKNEKTRVPEVDLDNLDIGVGHQEVTSQMSSLNEGLLDEQFSDGVSKSFVDLDRESEDVRNIKEAIIDLYLAIKIRSTDELDKINDNNLNEEKNKLMTSVDCFQILEYIRSSIEIIMNLKIDDLEKNDGGKGRDDDSEADS
jgi:hypothetical protein